MIFSFLIKKSKLKAIEIDIAFFHLLGNLKGRTLEYFFYASYILIAPIQTDTELLYTRSTLRVSLPDVLLKAVG